MYISTIDRPRKGDTPSRANAISLNTSNTFATPNNSRAAVRARIERSRAVEELWALPPQLRSGWSIAWLLREERRRRA